MEAQTTPARSTAVIITKPPEILAVFAIVTNQPPPRPPVIFAVFDSHSRPITHPNGAAFSFFGTARAGADYLARLLGFDVDLTRDKGMQWQAQLLSQLSAHCFVASDDDEEEPDKKQLEVDLFRADIATLEVRSALSEAKTELGELKDLVSRTRGENGRLGDEVKMLRIQLESARKALKKVEEERDRALAGGKTDTDVESSSASPSPPPVNKGKTPVGNPLPPPPRLFNQIEVLDGSSSTKALGKWSSSSGPHIRTSSTVVHHGPSGSKPSNGPFDSYDSSVQDLLNDQMLRDMQVAAEIQRELDRESDALMRQHELLIANSQQIFDCRVCMEMCPEDIMATLVGCEHVFCRECLLGHVKAGLEENKFPIVCPVCATEGDRPKHRRGGELYFVLDLTSGLLTSLRSCDARRARDSWGLGGGISQADQSSTGSLFSPDGVSEVRLSSGFCWWTVLNSLFP